MIPASLKPEAVTALIDTREQIPLDLTPLRVRRATLTTGDYSVVGLEHVVAIERKSLGDLLSCVGTERQRFDREVQRLLAFPTRALVVESTWPQIEAGEWRSKITPAAAIGSLLGWIAAGLPVIMCGRSLYRRRAQPERRPLRRPTLALAGRAESGAPVLRRSSRRLAAPAPRRGDRPAFWI